MEFSNRYTARVKAVPLFTKIDTGSPQGVQDTVRWYTAPKVIFPSEPIPLDYGSVNPPAPLDEWPTIH